MALRKTKICILTFSHNPYDGRIYHREAKSLARNGYTVSILTLFDGKRQEPIDENIRVKYIDAVHENIYFLFLIQLYKLFREALKERADIYHCHEPESHLVGLVLKIIKRKKLVLDVHEYYPDVIELAGRFYKYFYMLSCYVIEPLCCWMDNCIICADDEIKRLYLNRNKNVITIFNYPLIERWELNDNCPIHKNHNTLIYAGGFSEVRGIWLMLATIGELAKRFPDVMLLLLGDGPPALRDEMQQYIKERNLENNIQCIGNVPHTEVTQYLRKAGVGLLLYQPIKKFCKNIPTKQYEYAISELPIVGTDLPPIKEFIDDAKCGLLVPPSNIEEVVNAVSYIFTHSDEAKKMGENGKNAVYEKYNWELMEGKLIDIYSKLYKSHR
ncbi:MAG: glycosyltransferase family 4 protein [Bacteroidia bacterium]|nr:glycosyltransferase family 4 protein [Bacteroidia bacterium]